MTLQELIAQIEKEHQDIYAQVTYTVGLGKSGREDSYRVYMFGKGAEAGTPEAAYMAWQSYGIKKGEEVRI